MNPEVPQWAAEHPTPFVRAPQHIRDIKGKMAVFEPGWYASRQVDGVEEVVMWNVRWVRTAKRRP